MSDTAAEKTTEPVEQKETTTEDNKEEAPVEEDKRKCVLVSRDGARFSLLQSTASLSVLVKEMIDGEDDDEEDEEKEVPLPNVSADVLAKVVEFLEYHKTDPMETIIKPLKSCKMEEVVGEWYAKFSDIPVDTNQELIYDMIRAANYMDIKPLLDLMCAKVASMIKGKTPEEIRETFNITKDFTEKEEEDLKQANRWAEEKDKRANGSDGATAAEAK